MSQVPFVHVDQDLDAADVGTLVTLTEAEEHHLRRVLRLRDGARIEVADGVGHHALARLTAAGPELIADGQRIPRPDPALWVAQALPKARKLDEVIRQVTELGADGVAVIAAERSIVRLDGTKADRARQRWTGVARAACEQARRAWLPQVTGPSGVGDLLDAPGLLLVAHPGGVPLPQLLDDGTILADRVTVAIGPEGGWSAAEVTALTAGGAELVGLGSTVLRTEHAAAAALAVAAAMTGRWG